MRCILCVVYNHVQLYNGNNTFGFVQQYADHMPLKDIVIETVNYVIINVAQDDTGTNILLNFI